MKKPFIIILLSCFLVACTATPDNAEQKKAHVLFSFSKDFEFPSDYQKFSAQMEVPTQQSEIELIRFAEDVKLIKTYKKDNSTVTVYSAEIPVGCYGGIFKWGILDSTDYYRHLTSYRYYNLSDFCIEETEAVYFGHFQMIYTFKGLRKNGLDTDDIASDISDFSEDDLRDIEEFEVQNIIKHKYINIPFSLTESQSRQLMGIFGSS